MLYPGTPAAIRAFISAIVWCLSAPLLIAAAGILVWGLVMLLMLIMKSRPTPDIRVADPIKPAERAESERLRRIAEDETRKQMEEERIREQEKREAKAAQERARFHKVKQTRSATEAAKASLDEF